MERIDILKIDCEGAEFEILYSLTPQQLGKIDTMLGEIHNCYGFAGTRTAGYDWNAPTLKQYLGQHFTAITTDHRLESESAVLETFYATSPQSRENPLNRRSGGRIAPPVDWERSVSSSRVPNERG